MNGPMILVYIFGLVAFAVIVTLLFFYFWLFWPDRKAKRNGRREKGNE